MTQPDYYEPVMRFDLYSVVFKAGEWHRVQMFKGLSWLAAEVLAGVDEIEFCRSMENTGWIGTCPEWYGYMPVVAIPSGTSMGVDQVEFVLEEVGA